MESLADLMLQLPEELLEEGTTGRDFVDLLIFQAQAEEKRRCLAQIKHHLTEAERKAWDSLARYKFQMFGYWAAIWIHLNRIGGFNYPNPWKTLVETAKRRCEDV